MRIHGHGKASELAEQIKPALDLIGHGPTPAIAAKSITRAPVAGALDTAKIAKIVGGRVQDHNRTDEIELKEMGVTINARMSLNTWGCICWDKR